MKIFSDNAIKQDKSIFSFLEKSTLFRRILFFGLPISIIVASIFPLLFFKNFIGVTGDNPFSSLSEHFLYWSRDRLTIWNGNNFGAPFYYPTEISINIILGFIVWIGISTTWISKLVILFSLISSYFSIYYLISWFNKDKNTYTKLFISLISFLYVFNPLVFTRIGMSHYWYLIAYSIAPLILLCSLSKNRKIFIIGLLLFWISMIQIQFIVFGIILILLGTWVFLDISKRERILRSASSISFAILVNLFWILPFRSQQITLALSTDNTLFTFTRQSLFLNDALKGTGYNFDFYADIINASPLLKYWNILGYLPFLLFVSGIFQLYREKKFKIANIFLTVVVTTLTVVTGFRYFFKDIFYWIVTNFTPFSLFREMYHLEFIVFIVFFVVGSFAIKLYFEKLSSSLKKLLIGFIGLLVIFYSIPFFQINTDRYVPQITTTQNNSYKSLLKLNTSASEGEFRMLYVPLNSIVKYNSDQFIWGRNKLVPNTGIATIDTAAQASFPYQILYKNLFDSLANINLESNQNYFKNTMNRYSFRYFVLDQIVTPIDKLDLNAIKEFLNTNYPQIISTEGLKVYENANYYPLMSIKDSLTDINLDPIDLNYFNFDNYNDSKIYFDSYDPTNTEAANKLNLDKKFIDLKTLIQQSDLSKSKLENNKLSFPLNINSLGDYSILEKNRTTRIDLICQDKKIDIKNYKTNLTKDIDGNLSFESVPDQTVYTGTTDTGVSVMSINNNFINLDNCDKEKVEFTNFFPAADSLEIKTYKFIGSENIFEPMSDGNARQWTTTTLCNNDNVPKSDKETLESVKDKSSLIIRLKSNRGVCMNKTLQSTFLKGLIGIETATISDNAIIRLGVDSKEGGTINTLRIQPKSKLDKNIVYANIDGFVPVVTLNINTDDDSISQTTINQMTVNQYDNLETKLIILGNIDSDSTTKPNSFVNFEAKDYNFQLNVDSQNSINNGSFLSTKLWSDVGDCNKYDDKSIDDAGVYAKIVPDASNNMLELGAADHAACIYQTIPNRGNPNYFLSFQYKTLSGNAPGVVFTDKSGKGFLKIDDLTAKNEWTDYKGTFKTAFNQQFNITVFQDAFKSGFVKSGQSQFKNFELRQIIDNIEEPLLSKSVPATSYTPLKTNLNYFNSSKYVVDIVTDRDFYFTNGQVFHKGWSVKSAIPQFNNLAEFDSACSEDGAILREFCKINQGFRQTTVSNTNNNELHFKVNNFQNGWFIKINDLPKDQVINLPNGQKIIRLVFEYEPQKLFNVGLYFYIATLSLLVFILIIPNHFYSKRK